MISLVSFKKHAVTLFPPCRTFYTLLECCRYFSKQSSDCESSGMATILTDYKPGQQLSEALETAIQTGRSLGVQVEYAPEFMNRWKESNWRRCLDDGIICGWKNNVHLR